jgi:transcriptional regulator with XRE-family HTH domain
LDTEERGRVGARIGQARRESGLTQRELAARLGISTRSVQGYEAGAIVPWRHLRRIELITHKRSGWLLGGDDGQPGGDGTLTRETVVQLLDALDRQHVVLGEQLRLLRENTEALRRIRSRVPRAT